ncbi:YecA family protein [Marilutibacter aestuarii]
MRVPTPRAPTMTAPAYLDDARIEQLAELLEQRAVPFKGFNLEALDGYLSALAVGPEDVPASEWMPAVWGTPPRWADEAEREAVESLLLGHRNMAAARVRHGGDDLPDHLAPLLWLPEDPEEGLPEDIEDDELDVGCDWALGFFRGVELREAAWERWLDENDWIDEIFVLFDRLASGEVVGDDPTAPGTPVSYRERLEVIAGLPDMLADLHHHRIEALTPREPLRRADVPERNAPCPCGSGRKYKKCCGAAANDD